MSLRKRILASGLITLALGGAIPALGAAPAQAKSCKWVLVSYDPVTHTSTWVCTVNRP